MTKFLFVVGLLLLPACAGLEEGITETTKVAGETVPGATAFGPYGVAVAGALALAAGIYKGYKVYKARKNS